MRSLPRLSVLIIIGVLIVGGLGIHTAYATYSSSDVHAQSFGPPPRGQDAYACSGAGMALIPKDAQCPFSNGGGTYPCYSFQASGNQYPPGFYNNPFGYCYAQHDHYFCEGTFPSCAIEDNYTDDWYQYSSGAGTAATPTDQGPESCVGTGVNQHCDEDSATIYFVCDAAHASDPRCVALQPLAASCSVSPASATTGQSVTWTASPSGGTAPYTYLWSGTDSLNGSTAQNPAITYSTTGTKTGSVTVYDATYQPARTSTSYSPNYTDNVSCTGSYVSGYDFSYVDQSGKTPQQDGRQALYYDVTQTNPGNNQTLPPRPDGYGDMCASVVVTQTTNSRKSCDPDPSVPCNTNPTNWSIVKWYTGTGTAGNTADAYDGVSTFTANYTTIPASGASVNISCSNSVSVTAACTQQTVLTTNYGSQCTGTTIVQTDSNSFPPGDNTGASGAYAAGLQDARNILGGMANPQNYCANVVAKGSPTCSSKNATTCNGSYTVNIVQGSGIISQASNPSAGNYYGSVTASQSCTPPPAQPDLTPDAGSDLTVNLGDPIPLSDDISNIGNASTGSGFANVFLTNYNGSVWNTGVNVSTGALAAGGTATVSTTLPGSTFSAPGTYQWELCADESTTNWNGTISESNEGNNCSAWGYITVNKPQPDLTAGAAVPTTAAANASVTISATITNQGAASTGASFTNLFQMNPGSIPSSVATTYATTTSTSATLGAGASVAASANYTFPSAGTWYVRVCADSNNTITESDETNNCGGWTAVTVTQPDLVASTPTIGSVTFGSPTSLSGTITNQGTGSTNGAFSDLFELSTTSTPANFNAIAGKVRYASATLAAGANNTATGSYTFPTTGTWYVRLCADIGTTGTGVITESNENNNCSSSWTTVTVVAPDLTAGSVTPITAAVNTATTFSATVTNTGSAATGAAFTDLVQQAASYNAATGVAGGVTDYTTFSNPAMAASGSQNVTFTHTFTTNGAYYFRVCADKSSAADTGTITESNENNNCGAWTAITVGSAPVADLQVSMNSDGSNPQASLTVSSGTHVYLDWSCSNATSASMSSNVMGTTPNGVLGSSGSNANLTAAPAQTSAITQNTIFSINCTDSAGVKSSQTAEVNVSGSPPGGGSGSVSCAISLPASCASLPAGQPCSVAPGTDVTYNATVSNGAAAPYVWASSDGSGGPFGNTRTASRSYSSQGTYGMSVNATNASTTTCPYVQVSTGGGSCSQTAQASISVNPARVLKNGSTQVTWGGQGVTSCSLSRNGAAWKSQTADPASCLATTQTGDTDVVSQTTYCAVCAYTDGSGNTHQTTPVCQTVNLIPGFSEF